MDEDTEIGGHAGAFPETRHSAVAGARNSDPLRRGLSYEAIIGAYWKPVYRYIRMKWGKSNEDAKDLTQSFFTLAIDKNFVADYEPSQARFRTYLRTCLDRFLANQHKYEGRLKRSADWVPLDENMVCGNSADAAFQKEWTREVFGKAVDRLRDTLMSRGKSVYFEVFERYDLAAEQDRPAYHELAASLNLSTVNVTNYLASARREFRAAVYDELRAITGDERELRREALALLGP